MDALRSDNPSRRQSPLRALRFETIVSGFVGALALAVSTYNVYLQRAQIQAQVWPHLEWTYSEGEAFAWELTNAGVGPAIIKGVRIRVDGKIARTWNEAHELLKASDKEIAEAWSGDRGASRTSPANRVLGAGVKIEPLRVRVQSDDAHPAMRRAFAKLDVEICYCSTLGDCWMLSGDTPTRSCPADLDFAQ